MNFKSIKDWKTMRLLCAALLAVVALLAALRTAEAASDWRSEWGPPPENDGAATMGSDPTASPGEDGAGEDPDGAGGDCDEENECSESGDSEGCPPPDPNEDEPEVDPVLLPSGHFVHVEKDFSMAERGARFEITRTHKSGDFIDRGLVTGYGYFWPIPDDWFLGRGRNNIFGFGWNSTLQMYSYWASRNHNCLAPGSDLLERFNLGGYYVIDLPHIDPSDKDGHFAGPEDANWMHFDANTDDYCESEGNPGFAANPGVLTARDGSKRYFGYACDWDPNNWDPNYLGYADPQHR